MKPSLRSQFETLAALDTCERSAALVEIAAADPERARRLRVMLETDLEDAVDQPIPSIADALSGSLLQQRRAAFDANGFTPLRLLGRGGMGEVWLVERTVAGRSQSLALKLLQVGTGPAELWLARFRIEQRILLELDHPGIARLIDAGEAEGQPWIAMEYVDGLDVIEWCDAHKLDVEARLRLFQQVCAAVQYAHDRLIVHRDLKPANVLVNRRGEPKLLDFGIAKILDDNDAASFKTGTAQHLFSLYGVTPEQFRGDPPTVGTDVYALGALLYELLGGRQALEFEGLSLTGIEQRVLHESPLLPSQGLTPTAALDRGLPNVEALGRQLRGDLDRIVLHALRKHSHERYRSARDFSADIERFLTRQPVLAAGQGRAYRVGKFLRRHRIASAVATLVLALITAFIVQLRLERDAAERARDAAQRVSEFLIRMFELGDPTRSLAREISAAEMLEQGFKQLDEQQLDARTGAPVLLALAQAARGLGDAELIKLALESVTNSQGGLGEEQQVELKLVALMLRLEQHDHERSEADLRELQSLPSGWFSSAQRQRLKLYEIRLDQQQGRARLALEKLLGQAGWDPHMELAVAQQHARLLLELDLQDQIETVLVPLCAKLEKSDSNPGALADLLIWRARAAAKLGNAALATQLLTQMQTLVESRFGKEHLLTQTLLLDASAIWADIGSTDQAIALLTELVPALEKRLPSKHPVLSSANSALGSLKAASLTH